MLIMPNSGNRPKQLYFEIRSGNSGNALAADMSRHMHSRQYLGRVLVVCDSPFSLLSAMRKQWMRLTRAVQLYRARTLNAEEILRFTHAIMHMQHFVFSARPPVAEIEGHVYFLDPSNLHIIPRECRTVYLTTPITDEQLAAIARECPPNTLFVNYTDMSLGDFNMLAKSQLESEVLKQWEGLAAFLRSHGIIPEYLITEGKSYETANDALDTLLTTCREFILKAADFRHAIDLAQPLATISADYLKMFDAVTRLAHRVQTLAPPGTVSVYFFKTFGPKESYFLRDLDGAYLDTILAQMAAGGAYHEDFTMHTLSSG